MKAVPLKDKTLTYEQDYIETEIRWKLKLGDEIFKKSDVKKAVFWLKAEISRISNKKDKVSFEKVLSLINNSFSDVTTNKKKSEIPLISNKEDKNSFEEVSSFFNDMITNKKK